MEENKARLDWLGSNYHNIRFPHKDNGNKFRIFGVSDGVFEGETLRQAMDAAMLNEKEMK